LRRGCSKTKNKKVKTVQHSSDTLIGVVFGYIGGFISYLGQIEIHQSFSSKLIEASITAVVCGAAGVIGKEIVVYCKKKWFKK
jgi:hypothetical protein